MKKSFGSLAAGALPFSQSYRADDFVFLSGQVAFGPDGEFVPGSIEAETRPTNGQYPGQGWRRPRSSLGYKPPAPEAAVWPQQNGPASTPAVASRPSMH